jgi:hypothetical protein
VKLKKKGKNKNKAGSSRFQLYLSPIYPSFLHGFVTLTTSSSTSNGNAVPDTTNSSKKPSQAGKCKNRMYFLISAVLTLS